MADHNPKSVSDEKRKKIDSSDWRTKTEENWRAKEARISGVFDSFIYTNPNRNKKKKERKFAPRTVKKEIKPEPSLCKQCASNKEETDICYCYGGQWCEDCTDRPCLRREPTIEEFTRRQDEIKNKEKEQEENTVDEFASLSKDIFKAQQKQNGDL